MSQVLRWSLCSEVHDSFGPDVDRPLTAAQIPLVRRFIIALDRLRDEWVNRFSASAHVGNHPRKGAMIQYHFAKLYLCSHALRGSNSTQAGHEALDVAWEISEIADLAVLSARAILNAVVSDTEVQSFLNALPAYFNMMIAFATVSLLKVSTRFSGTVQLDMKEVDHLIARLVTVLKGVTGVLHSRHLLVSIAEGVEDYLQCKRLVSRGILSADVV